MKKKCTSFLAIILVAVMAAGLVSYDLAWAEEELTGAQSSVNSTTEVVEEEMDFLYIESPELESPAIQNIAISWDDRMTNATKFILVYSDSADNEYEIEEANRTEESVLFSKEFALTEVGTYKIKGLKYFVNGSEEEQLFDFNDLEINADFNVVDVQSDAVTEAIEDNTIIMSTDVATVSADMGVLLRSAAPSATAANENIVVVIDPGHGGDDPGACANGLKEKNLNLKIAKYLRDELKQYNGVDVYMTRETDKHLETATASGIANRVKYAANKNADLLVSVHINAGGGKGAEVWTPTKNYNENVYKVGQAVSSSILRELVALGLTNRGVQTKNCTDDGRYPDGSLEDYYGIIRESKKAGFTGIIVEHAFIDNDKDAAFLKSEANLKALGVADAIGIANYYRLTKKAANSAPKEATPAAVDNALKSAGLSYAEFTAPDQDSASMRGFTPGSDISTYVAKLEAVDGISDVSYSDASGAPITSGKVATGQIITFEMDGETYTRNVVVAGDVNGDGKIQATDYVKIKNHIMNFGTPLSGPYRCAADTNGDSMIYATDYVKTKNHIMGSRKIDQSLVFKVYQL